MIMIQPKKTGTIQRNFTVGRDRVNYPGEIATPTMEMLIAKLFFISIVSTKDAWFMKMNIYNFYFMMTRFLRRSLLNTIYK